MFELGLTDIVNRAITTANLQQPRAEWQERAILPLAGIARGIIRAGEGPLSRLVAVIGRVNIGIGCSSGAGHRQRRP